MKHGDTEALKAKLGHYLSEGRKSRNLSQEKLAELAELSTNHISKIERGESGVKFETVARICRVLELSLDDFIFSADFGSEPEEGYQQRMEQNRIEIAKIRLREAVNVAIDHVYKDR